MFVAGGQILAKHRNVNWCAGWTAYTIHNKGLHRHHQTVAKHLWPIMKNNIIIADSEKSP